MNIDTAIKRIIDNWDDWHAEAMQHAQIEQDGRAGDVVLERRLRDVLEKLAAPDLLCPRCNGSGRVFVALSGPETCNLCLGSGENRG